MGKKQKFIRSQCHRLFEYLRILVFPYKCIVCGSFFPPPGDSFRQDRSEGFDPASAYEKEMRPWLCEDCSSGFDPVESPLCTECGVMFKGLGEDHICGECEKAPKRFGMARAFGIYGREFAKAIHRYKYDHRIQLSKPFGSLLYSTFMRYWGSDGVDIAVPVPLHIRRFRNRGFNQAYHLMMRWPCFKNGAMRIERDLLVRTRWTVPQVRIVGYRERRSNIKNAFHVVDPSRIKKKRILLVDDVFTTGATVEECAKVLLKSGAQNVDVLTLARTS